VLLIGELESNGQPLLDRGHHASLHLSGGVPVAEADRAALVSAAVAAGVVHDFVDDPSGDAGVHAWRGDRGRRRWES
jgi:hypothetical protein